MHNPFTIELDLFISPLRQTAYLDTTKTIIFKIEKTKNKRKTHHLSGKNRRDRIKTGIDNIKKEAM